MREIDPDEAKAKYGVWTCHHEMSPGGELRFRLSQSDGTRYIRTERPVGAGSEWQDAHYHESVQETYIVQRGWIGFAEKVGDSNRLRILKEGAIVTSQPGVHHNVFMPDGAVIHTVKHGAGDGEDKQPSEEFNEETHRLVGEVAVLRSAEASIATENGRSTSYSDEYRHFDTLIWQMPGWSTAIFLGTAAVVAQANVESLKALVPHFSPAALAAAFLIVIFLFLFGLSQALYRFRFHQAPMKTYKPTKWWESASTWLQFLVTAQSFVVLFLALSAATAYPLRLAVGFVVAFVVWSGYRECRLRRNARSQAAQI